MDSVSAEILHLIFGLRMNFNLIIHYYIVLLFFISLQFRQSTGLKKIVMNEQVVYIDKRYDDSILKYSLCEIYFYAGSMTTVVITLVKSHTDLFENVRYKSRECQLKNVQAQSIWIIFFHSRVINGQIR